MKFAAKIMLCPALILLVSAICVFAIDNLPLAENTEQLPLVLSDDKVSIAQAKVSIRILDRNKVRHLTSEIDDGNFVHKSIRANEGDYIFLTIKSDENEYGIMAKGKEYILPPNAELKLEIDSPAEGFYYFVCTKNCKGRLKLEIRKPVAEKIRTIGKK